MCSLQFDRKDRYSINCPINCDNVLWRPEKGKELGAGLFNFEK